MDELAGLRALVVEDEGLVALLIEGMLEELGCEVAVSVATLAEAITAATHETLDFALLDVNLDGQSVFPVAEILRTREIPILFSTGYGRVGVPDAFKEYPVLSKPFEAEELEQQLRSALKQ
ncbi:response regulator [Mesorhizobium sp. RMAD-H1]|uniref:response regulator n=1 Tax=Mesorhizobium sp. RMAD-H1 TaxID=2587065 RepID=UPI00160B1811|nr:response regulator [Mesorhizobium sp. RMAD-H1]MBB2971457.1 CheY-like chemotaxis protein [Mesorhizobium sp. RMAD-H1]